MKPILILIIGLCALLPYQGLQAQTALDIITKTDELFRGKTSKATMKVTIVRPKWQKEMTLKSWSKGDDYMSSVVLSPAKEKGVGFLKRKNEVWNWMPSIERSIKLPPSMMMQNWLGTDFTNDDLVKQSSLVVDYTHEILAEESYNELPCWKLKLTPKEDAPVVWGKIIVWVDQKDYMQVKVEFYDEDDYLINILTTDDYRLVSGRRLPAKMEFIPVEKEGQKTVIEYTDWAFDIKIDERVFSNQYLSRLLRM